VAVLVQVVGSAPRAIQQQLAAQPGLLKALASFMAGTHLSSSTGGNSAAEPAGFAPERTCSSSSGKQQRSGSSSLEADDTPSSNSRNQLQAAAGALVHLLDCCGSSMPPPSYQDLAPALYSALQQRLVCLPALVGSVLRHHTSHMVRDQQLLSLVLDAADQGEGPAADVVVLMAPKLLEGSQPLQHTHHERVMALLAGGTAAGGALLAAALQQEGGTLWKVPGMVEAACSGLCAACDHASAVLATHSTSTSSSIRGQHEEVACLTELLQARARPIKYLRGLVDVVLHLANQLDSPGSSRLGELGGCLVPALSQGLSLLLESAQLPVCAQMAPYYRQGQVRDQDAAWAALLALSECPGAAALVAALFQHQPGLCQALAASWDQLPAAMYAKLRKSAETAAHLAARLLLRGSLPGQQERRHHQHLLVAAVGLWDRVWPDYWQGQADLLMELLRLPHGPEAVVQTPHLMGTIFPWAIWDFEEGLLGPGHTWDGLGLLLRAPDFHRWLVQGLARHSAACLSIVGWVWRENEAWYTQALLAVPGLGDALAQCCSMDSSILAVDRIMGYALCDEELQEYLAREPQLLQALVARLFLKKENAYRFWNCLVDDGSGDEWLLQQPALLDGVLRDLVVADSSWCVGWVVGRLLVVAPNLVCESLMRQPAVVEGMLRVLVQRSRQQQLPANSGSDDEDDEVNWPRLLLEGLANSHLASRMLSLLLGLLTRGDAELSAGVFEAMHLMQSRTNTSRLIWGELAVTSSRGAAVLCAEGQLQALRQGMEQVEAAAAATAATTQQLKEQQQAVAAAAGTQDGAPERHLPRRSKRTNSHGGPAVQQPAQQVVGLRRMVAEQEVVGSSQRNLKGRRKAAAGQRAVAAAGSRQGAGERLVPGKVVTAPPAASILEDGREDAEAPPAPKRTRR
jgi:hypothetical protein